MSAPFEIPTKTQEKQQMASNPKGSAWVSANAGSGKTYVLTQRVIRLLLEGCSPSRILCLTFTKAAAAEMSNRVFKLLGSWSTLDEAALKKAVEEIEQKPASHEKLTLARQLFAKALETPGGLKIQTIHAFCEALLHQFPIEANVPGHFSVIEGSEQMALLNEAKRSLITRAFTGEDEALAKSFAIILDHTSDDGFAKVFDELITSRDKIGSWLSHVVGQGSIASYIYPVLGLNESDDEKTIADGFIGMSLEKPFWQGVQSEAFNGTTIVDEKLFAAIDQYFKTQNKQSQLEILNPILFTKQGEMRKKIASAALYKKIPNLENQFLALVSEISEINDRLKSLKLARASTALFTLGDHFLGNFETLKKQRGVLDFEDLIIRTANLLQRSDARAWVQYKLDRGIDHILIDEAQDTSPRQWQVINAIIDEFYAGNGARDVARTVFAVGDEKQSIYSFQGAEPDAFADQRDRIGKQAELAQNPFKAINLELSFRSSLDVLSAVDKVFESYKNFSGLGRDAQKPIHETIRKNDPGRVDIWPIFKSDKREMPEDWADPVDHLGKNSPITQLAEHIALEVRGWLDNKSQIFDKESRSYRPIRAGDINILVRSRSEFDRGLIRAFKNHSINVAGSDRLVISDHIAIQDLIALGQVMVLNDDDLSLGAVLKSPLFGFDENQLFELANGRGELSLRDSLAQKASSDEFYAKVFKKINFWTKAAREKPVYEFYAQILNSPRGRQAFFKRFGSEVQDVLDAFLLQALNSETSGLPGLEAFLVNLVETAPEIKREQNLTKDEVRIMTVHASKGLEAPIVFLVDHGRAPHSGRHNPNLIELPAKSPREAPDFLWLFGNKSNGNKRVEQALGDIALRAQQEYLRLLYVGMTRAADRLILCGYSGQRPPHEECWYNVVKEALNEEVSEVENCSKLLVKRWQKNKNIVQDNGKDQDQKGVHSDHNETPLPDWVFKKLPTDPPLPKPLTPSGAAVLLDEFEPVAEPVHYDVLANEKSNNQFERGLIIHALLQHLPEKDLDKQRDIAQNYVENFASHWHRAQQNEVIDLVLKLIRSKELSELFSPQNSRAEVALTGAVTIQGKMRMVTGQIDRLVEFPDRILLVDYKSNHNAARTLEEVPKAYLVQMALYKILLQEIYPDKTIEAYLLWTNRAELMALPAKLLETSLSAITKS